MCQNGCKKKCNCKVITIPKGEKGDSGTTCINITYAALATLKTNSLLVDGAFYKITNRADLGIIVRALSVNKLSLDGEGYFLNPDYGNTFGNNLGVWHSGLGGISIGKKVIYSGLQYSSITGVVGTAPNTDAINWLLIPKSVSTYVLEIDIIRYDFDNNSIIYRTDKRNNEVYRNINVFQWGNNTVENNKDYSGLFNIINARTYIVNNICDSFSNITINETNTGTLTISTLSSGITFNDFTGTIDTCFFNAVEDIIIENNTSYINKTIINDVVSTFNAELDISDGNIFNGTVLTIPSSLKHIGIFTLINSSGEIIDEINGLPRHNKVRFYVEDGNNIIFEVNDIGSFTPNYIVGAIPANYTLIGRSFAPDFIELESSEDINSGDFVNTVYKIVIFQP